MRRLPSLLVIVLCCQAANAAPRPPKAYGAWTVTCDNLGACVVLGAADADDLLYLRIARAAGVAASPEVKIVLASQVPVEIARPTIRLEVVGSSGPGSQPSFGPFAATEAGDTLSAVLRAPEAVSLVDALRNAATLDVDVAGHKGTFVLKGFSAAVRDMDDRQGRAGTPTALVAKGMTPIGQVPAAGAPPVVVAARPGSVEVVEHPTLSARMRWDATKTCDAVVVAAHEGLQAWRLGGDRVLTAVPCEGGAYNLTSILFETRGDGPPVPVPLPRPPGLAPEDGGAANLVVNAAFDPKTMVLTSFAKGRGVGDCGMLTDWLWTGASFALLDASGIEACPGALPDDWPSTYSAVRK